jgi:hypothetical protein
MDFLLEMWKIYTRSTSASNFLYGFLAYLLKRFFELLIRRTNFNTHIPTYLEICKTVRRKQKQNNHDYLPPAKET